MKLGLGIGGPLPGLGALAGRAEAAGFESVWLAELDHSAFAQAGAVIGAGTTSRLLVGTAVALAFPRSPTITAMTAWDLDELSGGRFLLGLGPQVRRVMESRFSVAYDHPAERLAEYVRAVRTIWAANRGERVTHEGEHYRITMPTFHGRPQPDRRDVPILLAAVGPVMARTCGEVADGLVGHPLASRRYLRERIMPAVEKGLELAGRPADACPMTASLLVSIGEDADEARRAARIQLAFYATTPSYRPILELHDRGDRYGDLRRAFVRSDMRAMAELIDDEFLDAVAIAGTPDEARDRLREWDVPVERAILAIPWYRIDPGREREQLDALLELGRSISGSTPATAAAERPTGVAST